MEVSARLVPAKWDAEPQPFIGGLISVQAALNVLKAWQEHVARGAKTLLEPKLVQPGTSLLTPGIIEMSATSNVPDEEVFGPLLCVWRYDDFESAIEMANNTRYGLSSGLISPHREIRPAAAGSARRDRELEQTADRCGEHCAVWWRRGVGQPSRQRPVCRRLLRVADGKLETPALTLPETLNPGLDFTEGDAHESA